MKAVTPSLAVQDNDLADTGTALLPGATHSTAELLVTGGDPRIQLDDDSGCNRYGCRPWPDPELIALGSSTASVISPEGFAAADYLHRRIALQAQLTPPTTYERELERIRRELRQLCRIDDVGVDIVFGASGTDLHLIAGQLAACLSNRPIQAVMAEPSETGSGVPQALGGRHFSTRAALGAGVEPGKPVTTQTFAEAAGVPLRDANGRPRPAVDVDADICRQVEDAIDAGYHVLLVMTDLTKTGLIAPSAACVAALRERWSAREMTVLVDACQFRLAPETLRAYLGQDFLVALTGSKFLAGPTFAGALLVPVDLSRQLAEHALPDGLHAYSARAEWPSHWRARERLDSVANFGLLLRWEAALQELRAFSALSSDVIESVLRRFADALLPVLRENPAFEYLAAPALDRHPLASSRHWDRLPTLFSFRLYRRRAGERHPLTLEETRQIYARLAQPQVATSAPASARRRIHLGQPVQCGSANGQPLGALRLCLSSRLIVIAAKDGEPGLNALIENALTALEKVAWLVDNPLPTAQN